MKKLLFSLLFLLTFTALMAQAPQRISYQSIIRDANNVVVASSPVGIKISFLRGTDTGPAVYVETHPITTNANGLVSLNIGEGRAISGRFAEIDWSKGPYLIQTATDPTGGTDYSIVGTAPLNSVPYALNAANATKLQVPVTINGIAFDGSSNVTIPATGAVPYTGATQGLDLGAYDLKVNEVTVGRGNGNIASNTATGNEALASNTTGSFNTASGANALLFNTTGNTNTASGVGALNINTTGSFNTATGLIALGSNATGSYNTAIGNQADVGSGALTNATAIGAGATVFASNTIQLGNTSVTNVKTSGTLTAGTVTYPNIHGGANQVLTTTGTGTLTWATPSGGVPYTGATRAVNLGAYDLQVNGVTVGRGKGNIVSNTANGVNALVYNTTGANNTATGLNALRANTTGYGNTASGSSALYQNTTGSNNTASGYAVLFQNTTGSENTAIGQGALFSNNTGSNNTAIGNQADVGSGALTNATAIGAGATVLASNTIQLGNTSVTNVKTSGTLTAGAVTYPSTHGAANQFLTTTGTGTLTWATPSGGVPYTGATQGVDLGAYDLQVNGVTVGRGNGNGESNTATGNEALASNTTGSFNLASGAGALKANTTGSYNTASGEGALSANTSGSLNMASGNIALLNNTTGDFNTASGNATLFNNTSGSYNTASGIGALYQNTTGSNNTAIGNGAGVGSGALTNTTAIGSGATVLTSNTIQLGNTDVTKVITSGTLTAGTVTYPNTAGTNGQVLTTDGSGTLTWASTSAPTYSVGLNPALGGYVFYVTPDGKHGLVAETIDQLGAVDFLPENINPNITPAETADDNISNPARHSAAGANFIDWRLPNKYEMLLMYNSRQNIGNFDPTRNYLTSTLSYFYVGWAINFANAGLPVDYNLYFKYNNSSLVYKDSIRAVRAF
jgi:trimeric autotransporter adhesin